VTCGRQRLHRRDHHGLATVLIVAVGARNQPGNRRQPYSACRHHAVGWRADRMIALVQNRRRERVATTTFATENSWARGLAFPLQINQQGDCPGPSAHDIEQAIRIVLETQRERVMRPEFGCRVHELLFAPLNAASAPGCTLCPGGAGRWDRASTFRK